MAAASVNEDVSMISKGLYRIVSDVIGPESIVKLRRQGHEIYYTLVNCDSSLNKIVLLSGSRAEGFVFKSSDIDCMYVDKSTIVVNGSTVPYNNKYSVFIMESDNITPGFAFVKLLRCDLFNTELSNSFVFRGGDIFISSKIIRETFMSTSISTCHGPCQTSTYNGFENDNAFTLNYPTWPQQAVPFIRRSLDRGWPSYNVLNDICTYGCLLVPINSKHQQYSDMNDLEWRISFSLAEKKLVHSMNHCQFLCYGLSKIFLNEVIKKIISDADLLCSYFMKTSVFWEISENSREWTSNNLLSKFWNVFRRLLKWVSIGYCPNFFISENNMFYGKIYGETQSVLLETLGELHSEGYTGMLRSLSLNERLLHLIIQPEVSDVMSSNEEGYAFQTNLERERCRTICMFDIVNDYRIKNLLRTLDNTLNLKPKSEEMLYAKRFAVSHIVQDYIESSHLFVALPTCNRNRKQCRYLIDALKIIRRTKTYFCMNYFLLIKHMYTAGNYHRAIDMIHHTRVRLQSRPYMYMWNLNTDIIMELLQQNVSHDALIKSFVVSSFKMDKVSSIDELRMECLAAHRMNGGGLLCVPPLVFLDFLLILSYTKLGENVKRTYILDKLKSLLHQDDGYHIRSIHKAISWEILGICQQFCKDFHGALQSYENALHDEYNFFTPATVERINHITNIISLLDCGYPTID